MTDTVFLLVYHFYRAAVDITYPFFSTPMNAASFRANIQETLKLKQQLEGGTMTKTLTLSPAKPLRLARLLSRIPQQVPNWSVTTVVPDNVYQIGAWFVDVRHGVQGTECLSFK